MAKRKSTNSSLNYSKKKSTPRKKSNSGNRKGIGFLIAFLVIFIIVVVIKSNGINPFNKEGGFFSKLHTNRDIVEKDNRRDDDKSKTTIKDDSNSLKVRDSNIYFTLIKDDNLILTPVHRSISYIDNPLEETLKMLMKGPTSNEEDMDIVTNIPDMTELKSVSIKNDIAYLDFSDEFEWNQYGKESIENQLKQIVYTATEFSNIKGVQFLIDGEIKEYLGGDGIIINKALKRGDFD